LGAVASSRLLFQKPARSITGININGVITGFISPPSYIRQYSIAKKADLQEFRTLNRPINTTEKEKARQRAGLP